jgi:hypothetical protein
MELENPQPDTSPFQNRRKTIRREEDISNKRRAEVIEGLLTGVICEVRVPLTAARHAILLRLTHQVTRVQRVIDQIERSQNA